jgi:hypothetical protein
LDGQLKLHVIPLLPIVEMQISNQVNSVPTKDSPNFLRQKKKETGKKSPNDQKDQAQRLQACDPNKTQSMAPCLIFCMPPF